MTDKLEALKAKKPADTKSLKAQAAGYVTDDNSGGYYVVECQECGEIYPSQECDGGGQIADTGDYNDALCPHCGCESPDECNDTPLVWNVQQAKINALLAALEEKDQRIKALESAALVPGALHCAKCQFQLIKTNLYMKSGTTGPGDSKSEPCPNGCGPLWPVTWKQYATDAYAQVDRYYDECKALEQQLQQPAIADVMAERQRQVGAEGYDHFHDDSHVNDEIAALAAWYVMPQGARGWDTTSTGYGDTLGQAILPGWRQPTEKDRRRELVIGAALTLAEIERLDRASANLEEGR